MKHSMAVILLSLATAVAYAQTNTFPSTGNAGVGTMTPVNKLTVQTATNNTGIVHTDGTIRVGTYVGGSAGWLGTVSNHPLYFYTNNGSAQIALLTNGRVGIGTAAPAGKLEVTGGDAYIQSLRIGRGRATGNLLDSTNTCVGKYSLQNNDATNYSSITLDYGAYNAAFGYGTLANNTSGYGNTAIGAQALQQVTVGECNTGVGSLALFKNTGRANTAVGQKCLWQNEIGNYNTAIGNYANSSNVSGSFNVAVGYTALTDVTNGNRNVAIGSDIFSYYNTPNLTNAIIIGSGTPVGTNNQARIGNSSVTSIGGFVNWTNISDGRVKRNVKENVPGIDFIKLLMPVTYNLKLDEIDKLNHVPAEKTTGEKDKTVLDGRKAKESVTYTGFIAQDVEKAAKTLGFNFSGVDAPKDKDGLYGIRYAEFVVPLVKAVQELSAENEKLKAEISEIKAMLMAKNGTVTATGSLGQNVPNPSNNSTVIHYTLPAKYISASLAITNSTGEKIKTISLLGIGKGSTVLNTNGMAAGAYQYTLYINNNLIETKQMIIAR